MAQTLSRDGLAAWRAFLEAHAAVTRALESDLLREQQLPLAWYDVLVQLSESGGSARMQDLARRVLLSKSGLTRLCERMEAARMVVRRPCDDDGRGVEAALTPQGRARLRRAAPVHLRGIERYFAAHLDTAAARSLTPLMQEIATAARAEEV